MSELLCDKFKIVKENDFVNVYYNNELHNEMKEGFIRYFDFFVNMGCFNPSENELLTYYKVFEHLGGTIDLIGELETIPYDPDVVY